jgi:hypothetical protein
MVDNKIPVIMITVFLTMHAEWWGLVRIEIEITSMLATIIYLWVGREGGGGGDSDVISVDIILWFCVCPISHILAQIVTVVWGL